MLKKLSLLIILLTCYLINPEVIILENGKIINGKIIKMDEDTMTVITKNKEMVIDRDKIIQTFRSFDDYNKYKKSLENNNKTYEKGNLIAEWLFNGNATDTSGNELHGKVFKYSSTEDRFGNKNNAFEFGIGKTRAIASINKIILQQQLFSISLWVKINKFRGDTKIIDLINWKMKKGYSIICSSKNSTNYETWFSDGTKKNSSTKVNLKKDIWYHIVCVYNNNKAKIYLNGEFKNEGEINNNYIFNTNLYNTYFYFGVSASKKPQSYQFYGCIDDIRFYDYALSEQEIKELYHEKGWPIK